MIPLDTLRAALAAADRGEMNVQSMNSRKDMVLLSTLRPGMKQVGMFLDTPGRPQEVALFRAVANAEFCRLAYEWMPRLLDEIERLRGLLDDEEVELATKAAGGRKR